MDFVNTQYFGFWYNQTFFSTTGIANHYFLEKKN